MMYGLSEEDLRIRDTAQAFVESLMPHEVEAELAGGLLPKELTAEHPRRAIELGLYATNMPESVGGPGCTALQQVLVQEQGGRVTNGLAWVMAHSAAVVAAGGHRLPASSAGCCRRCAARSTSATRSPRSSPAPTSRTWQPPRIVTATST